MKNDNCKSNDGKHIEDKRDSYFAVILLKRRKQLLKFGVLMAVAVVAFGIFVTIQAHQQGFGTDIVYHIHPNLTLILEGNPIPIPKNIGIDSPLYKDHSLDRYSMAGMAPIHTHGNSGVIHVESTTNRSYTLDEFLDIWGPDFNDKAVQITVNGRPVNGLDYVLKDRDDIIMEIKQQ
jgi:hypothetical protein